MAKEKLTELKGGMARFEGVGTVQIGADTFKGASCKEDSFWNSVNTSLALNIKEGQVVYPQIRDGYMTNNPVLKRPRAERKDGDDYLIEIPFAERMEEEQIAKVASHALYKTNIVKNEEGVSEIIRNSEGKTALKQFISGVDFEAYLKENLVDGTPVRIVGSVAYSLSKDGEKVYRNFEISGVYLNQAYMKNGEEVPAAEPSATITQTYLLDADSLDKRWEKELENDGQTTVRAFVPQYMSKMWDGKKYAEVKKTVALPTTFLVKVDPTDEKALEGRKNVAKMILKVGKRDGIREATLINTINEGYETGNLSTTNITKELQDLIDIGGISLDQIQSQTVVRGTRVSETIFKTPSVVADGESLRLNIEDGKYDESVLALPVFDNDEDVATSSSASEPFDAGMNDQALAELFGM